MQQVQLAFAHAYHVLSNAVRNDDSRCCKKYSATAEHFLCTDSILSQVLHMPHQLNMLHHHHGDFSEQKLTFSERRVSRQKQTVPCKKHKLNITR